MSFIKKTSFLALASLILLQSGFAFGFSRVDKYYFLDGEGESIADMECHSLAYEDNAALRKLVSRGEELTVDSVEIKSKTMSIIMKSEVVLVLDLQKSRCNLSKEY